MAKYLCKDMDEVKKAYLGNLARHEGFKILQEMGEDFCKQATASVISLDPVDDQYEVKLKTLQIAARVANDFCSSFFGSVEWHVRESLEFQKQQELQNLFKQEVA
jgi:hypothetical protein